MEMKDLPCPVFSIDSAHSKKQFAVGLANGASYICSYDVNANSQEYEPY
jgi:hypothetical protein